MKNQYDDRVYSTKCKGISFEEWFSVLQDLVIMYEENRSISLTIDKKECRKLYDDDYGPSRVFTIAAGKRMVDRIEGSD